MSLSEKKYTIKGRKGNQYSLTAKELYERVMHDSKSDYDWIASAPELVRVCKQFEFPKEYAQGIQMAILNCFANIEFTYELQNPMEADAVNFCYNALADISEEATKVRQKYLNAVIECTTKHHFGHYGPTYQHICDEWEKTKFDEYNHMSSLDFKKVRKALNDEFDETIKEAEKEGAFQKDDAQNLEEMKEFMRKFSSSTNIFI